MSISFDRALGIHQQALSFRAQRAEVLANNLANADTPNYKARDLDFAAVLAEQKDKAAKGTFATRTTNERHIAAEGFGMGEGSLQYRIPVQPSIDQNTVDAQIEQANYAENAIPSGRGCQRLRVLPQCERGRGNGRHDFRQPCLPDQRGNDEYRQTDDAEGPDPGSVSGVEHEHR